jgi:hypothetical protein
VRANDGFALLYARVDRSQIAWGEGVTIQVGLTAATETDGVTFRMNIMDFTEMGLAEWRSERHGPPLRLKKGENHFTFPVDSIRLKAGLYFCSFIFTKPLAAQYLVLAFRHQELTVEGEPGGLCPCQL